MQSSLKVLTVGVFVLLPEGVFAFYLPSEIPLIPNDLSLPRFIEYLIVVLGFKTISVNVALKSTIYFQLHFTKMAMMHHNATGKIVHVFYLTYQTSLMLITGFLAP